MVDIDPELEHSWKKILIDEFQKDYFKQLKLFLLDEKKKYRVFPEGKNMFTAFNLTPFNNVKVVILGQDPYHGNEQAHGLSFSVQDGIKQPPSLKNIFKELSSDLDLSIPVSGNLSSWAKQGVLLLNATLSVRAGKAGSHQKRGWEQFTNRVIREISDKKENVVFLLWGRFAQNKAELIDKKKH